MVIYTLLFKWFQCFVYFCRCDPSSSLSIQLIGPPLYSGALVRREILVGLMVVRSRPPIMGGNSPSTHCSTALGAELLANDVAELLLADLIDALPRVEAAHLDHKSQALLQLLWSGGPRFIGLEVSDSLVWISQIHWFGALRFIGFEVPDFLAESVLRFSMII